MGQDNRYGPCRHASGGESTGAAPLTAASARPARGLPSSAAAVGARNFVDCASLVVTVATSCVLWAALLIPSAASGYAAPGAEATPGSPGLPNGRIYEQVSPPNKYGNAAGQYVPGFTSFPLMALSADGNGAAFSVTGPIGESATGFAELGLSKRSQGGWASSDALPRAIGNGVLELSFPGTFDVSADMTKTLFTSIKAYNAKQVSNEGIAEGDPLYLAGAAGQPVWYGEPVWVGEPQIPNPEQWSGPAIPSTYTLAGASSDFNTIYFNWSGTLTTGDNVPDPALEGATRSSKQGMGFFEWRDGVLKYAGTLPDGTVDPYGAQSPGWLQCVTGDGTRNQVSADGTRAFFVSPSPESAAPTSDPPELYVHKLAPDGTTSSVLASRDDLLPAAGGLPAIAPHPPVDVTFPRDPGFEQGQAYCLETSYMYAAPDGSRAFFESTDRLTASAPSDGAIKEYEFNVATETLTYLPGVTVGDEQGTSPIVASNEAGSELVFERNSANPGETLELDLWRDGPAGPSDGQVMPIAAMPAGTAAEIGPVHIVGNGSVVVFDTNAVLAGFNNGGFSQIYRYDAASNTLSCVSCPPAGVTPSSPAFLSHDYPVSEIRRNYLVNRGVSEDGSRVFFDTSEALVPQDVNGHRDVYEWEGGQLFLISTGTSPEDSVFGDNTPSGNDVIFSTAQGLAPGDTDEAYDVYDARVPRPGDYLPPSSLPCTGDVCQGPPSVPNLPGVPASASFSGLGNPAVEHATVEHHGKEHVARRRKKRRRAHKHRKPTRHGAKRKGRTPGHSAARHGIQKRSISTTKGKG